MAIRLMKTTGTLATLGAGASNWERIEASNLAVIFGGGSSYRIALNTARYVNVTFGTNSNQTGFYMMAINFKAGTFTIKLQEQTSPSVWTDRTTDSWDLTASPLAGNNWYYFPLTTYAVTTTASTWRYELYCTSGTPITSVTTSGGTDLLYAVVCDADSAAFSNNDTLLLYQGITCTLDKSITLGATGSSYICMCMGQNSTFQWENPPVASYTLTCPGAISSNADGNFLVGSSGNPIPNAQQAIIDFSATSTSYGFIQTNNNVSYMAGLATYVTQQIQFWGEEDTKMATRIAADAAQGQPNIVTTVDMSSDWAIGNTVTLIGKQKTNVDATTYTISNIVGTTITLSANLDYKLLSGGAILNITRGDNSGISILGRPGAYTGWGNWCDNMVFVGCKLQDCSVGTGSTMYGVIRKCLYRNVISNLKSSGGNYFATSDGTISNLYLYNTSGTYYRAMVLTGNRNTVTNFFFKNTNNGSYTTQAVFQITGNQNTVTGAVAMCSSNVLGRYGYAFLGLSGVLNVVADFWCYGSAYAVWLQNSYKSTITDLVYDGILQSGIVLQNTNNIVINDAVMNIVSTTAVAEIENISDTSNSIVLDSPDLGTSTTIVSNMTGAILGSTIKMHNYDTVANDHRTWLVNGYYQSTGDSLTDTTIHTAGTGKFALRFESLSSTDALTWEFDVPTGDISTKTMTVAVWVKINSANYYSVSYTLPRLTINYDNGTTAYAQASASTAWQQLFVTFTPITTYGQITVTLSTLTDQTGSSAYVYWDDFSIMLPSNVALDLGGMDLWANALPITPPLAIPISAYTVSNAVWEELISSHTTAATMGKKLGKQLWNSTKMLGAG